MKRQRMPRIGWLAAIVLCIFLPAKGISAGRLPTQGAAGRPPAVEAAQQTPAPAPGAEQTPIAEDTFCETCEVVDMDAIPVMQTRIAATLTQQAQLAPPAPHSLSIYFFWGDGCPHCAAAKPFLDNLVRRYPQVTLNAYEVWYVEENRKIFFDMAAAFGFEPHAVPTILIGERYWEGYADVIARDIERYVAACVQNGCPDKGSKVLGLTTESAPAIATEMKPAVSALELPLLGTVDLASKSLWVSTLLIAFVDGFNPCSVWVLTMLLAITLHSGSRKRVMLVGVIFLSVTALIYALFIAGLFTVFTFVSFSGWVRVLVALAALFFALVNIKDYFRYKEGISFTISDEKKPGLFKRMRALIDAGQSTAGVITGTVVLAAGVSLVEFSCTAGFPVLWTNLLAAHKVGAAAFVLLLLLYMLIYQLDELVIFFSAVFTLKASRLEEKHGRLLKLGSGMLMLCLAVVMLINPALMNDLGSALLVFAVALIATLLVLFIHRLVLPRLRAFSSE